MKNGNCVTLFLFSVQDFAGECWGCVEFQAVSMNYSKVYLKKKYKERFKN